MSFAASVHAKAIELVRAVVEMTTEAGSGHPSSATSLAHIVTVLLYDQMQFEPLQPDHPVADRLVLSEGHACPIVYAAAADLGFAIATEDGPRSMEPADLHGLRRARSPLEGHPNPDAGFPFFATATGSLGQGLSMATGLALAARLDGIDKRVFCIVGDGESREGQVWEAVDALVDERLHAVCPIFNCNGWGQTEQVSEQQSPSRLAEKLRACGFEVRRVDGHDPDALRAAFGDHAKRELDQPPIAVVAETTKGWGTELLQGDMHGKALSGEQAEQALAALDELREQHAAGADSTALRQRDPVPTAPAAPRDVPHPPSVNAVPRFEQALHTLDRADLLAEERIATREAHGIGLQMLGHLRPDVVVLDGDVSNSTFSGLFAGDPELRARFLQCRIGEQHMMSCAAGLAAAGKRPFVTSFGRFLQRGYDQLEMSLLSRARIQLVGSHVGISPSADGPSQMALADVGFCHALASTSLDGRTPLMRVLTPCDARAAYALTIAMADRDETCYLRTQRTGSAHVYGDDTEFPVCGAHVLASGSDVAIVAWGRMVHEALAARRQLAEGGIDAAVVDAYSLPLDADGVLEVVRGCGYRVVVVEDNYGAGLGSAVAEAAAARGVGLRLAPMSVTRVPHSARTPDQLVAGLGLAASDITSRARGLVAGAS